MKKKRKVRPVRRLARDHVVRAVADPYADPLIPLIRAAGQQIDAEPGGRLGWLLRFVREDPATWLPGNREAHGHRLLALMYGPLPDGLVAFSRPVSPVAHADVDAMHAQLGAFFRALVSAPAGGRVPVPAEGLEEDIVKMTAPGDKPMILGLSRRGPRPTMVLQAAKTLVLAGADSRLLDCKECGRPFLALRKKLFCSQPCLQKYYDARRPKKGERA